MTTMLGGGPSAAASAGTRLPARRSIRKVPRIAGSYLRCSEGSERHGYGVALPPAQLGPHGQPNAIRAHRDPFLVGGRDSHQGPETQSDGRGEQGTARSTGADPVAVAPRKGP